MFAMGSSNHNSDLRVTENEDRAENTPQWAKDRLLLLTYSQIAAVCQFVFLGLLILLRLEHILAPAGLTVGALAPELTAMPALGTGANTTSTLYGSVIATNLYEQTVTGLRKAAEAGSSLAQSPAEAVTELYGASAGKEVKAGNREPSLLGGSIS